MATKWHLIGDPTEENADLAEVTQVMGKTEHTRTAQPMGCRD
jgi:hypothetical protein